MIGAPRDNEQHKVPYIGPNWELKLNIECNKLKRDQKLKFEVKDSNLEQNHKNLT